MLLALVDEREPVRRFDLAEWAAALARWPKEVRDLRPLSVSAVHATLLAERADAAIAELYHREQLLLKPSHGRYELSPAGRREARRLRQAGLAKAQRALGRRAPRASGRAASRERADADGTDRRMLPGWAQGLTVGTWRPFEPIAVAPTQTPAPFTWDAEDKDAEIREHAEVLNRLHTALQAAGIASIRGTTRPACDLAFGPSRGVLTIVEAKSLPTGSDEHQMRVGLGQVLEYREELTATIPGRIRAIVAVPRPPDRQALWRRVYHSADVELLTVGPHARAPQGPDRPVDRAPRSLRRQSAQLSSEPRMTRRWKSN